MQEPDDILEPLLAEAKRTLVEMKKTKTLEERKTQSEILKNLCQSAGVFFDFMTDAMLADEFNDLDDFPGGLSLLDDDPK